MIAKIRGYTYKSWKDTSSLSSANFKELNIIFGHNGAGKSSLARGIAQEYRKTDKNKDAVRLFGSKYADSTLMLEDKSGIKGVVSSFGEKDVELENKIKTNNTEITRLEGEIKKDSTARDLLVKSTDSLIKDIVTRRKDKNKKINNKPADKTVQERAQLWIDDYTKARKEFPKEDYNLITGAMDYTAESDQINNLLVPQHIQYDGKSNTEISDILHKSFAKVEVPEDKVISWLQDGLHIHENQSICEFCGGNLDSAVIKVKIEAYVNDERHKASLKLQDYSAELNKVITSAQQIIRTKETYISTLHLKETDFTLTEQAIVFLSDHIKNDISEKIKDMTKDIAMPDAIAINIQTVDDCISLVEETKKARSKDITDKINKLETLVKGAVGYEIQNTQTISDSLKTITTHQEKIEKHGLARDGLSRINIELASQKSDLADFAIYLNGVLGELSLNFKLELSGKSYVLKHADGTPLRVIDISDGERNILALVYFYYEMLADSNGAIKETIKLIVIDDPISSLDDANKFYITELVRNAFEQNNAQVFVLTHSWEDFCNMSYGRENRENTALFEIAKKTGISSIDCISGQRLIKPYKLLYKEVYDFAQKSLTDITDDEVLHMPNIMRRVLEDYIKFVVDVDFATAHKSGAIANALFGEELTELSNTKKQKLNVLLSICNILSHKANQPKNKAEVHSAAKFLMASIENHNKYHHHSMKN